MDIQQFIGKTLPFAALPYHAGTMEITGIEEVKDSKYGWNGYYIVHGVSHDANETSRLGGCSSTRKRTSPLHLKLYHYSAQDIERAVNEQAGLRFTYPV